MSLRGIADFNGDGSSDLLLRNQTGAWRYYAMDGLNVLSNTKLKGLATNPSFKPVAFEDFDNDGNADVLLRRTTGAWRLFLMDGSRVKASASVKLSSLPFIPAAATDFDNDGNTDALVRNASNGSWRLVTI